MTLHALSGYMSELEIWRGFGVRPRVDPAKLEHDTRGQRATPPAVSETDSAAIVDICRAAPKSCEEAAGGETRGVAAANAAAECAGKRPPPAPKGGARRALTWAVLGSNQ